MIFGQGRGQGGAAQALQQAAAQQAQQRAGQSPSPFRPSGVSLPQGVDVSGIVAAGAGIGNAFAQRAAREEAREERKGWMKHQAAMQKAAETSRRADTALASVEVEKRSMANLGYDVIMNDLLSTNPDSRGARLSPQELETTVDHWLGVIDSTRTISENDFNEKFREDNPELVAQWITEGRGSGVSAAFTTALSGLLHQRMDDRYLAMAQKNINTMLETSAPFFNRVALPKLRSIAELYGYTGDLAEDGSIPLEGMTSEGFPMVNAAIESVLENVAASGKVPPDFLDSTLTEMFPSGDLFRQLLPIAEELGPDAMAFDPITAATLSEVSLSFAKILGTHATDAGLDRLGLEGDLKNDVRKALRAGQRQLFGVSRTLNQIGKNGSIRSHMAQVSQRAAERLRLVLAADDATAEEKYQVTKTELQRVQQRLATGEGPVEAPSPAGALSMIERAQSPTTPAPNALQIVADADNEMASARVFRNYPNITIEELVKSKYAARARQLEKAYQDKQTAITRTARQQAQEGSVAQQYGYPVAAATSLVGAPQALTRSAMGAAESAAGSVAEAVIGQRAMRALTGHAIGLGSRLGSRSASSAPAASPPPTEQSATPRSWEELTDEERQQVIEAMSGAGG